MSLRGAEEEFRHTEKSCAVLEVEDVSVEESVKAGIERGVVEVVVPHQGEKAVEGQQSY